MEIIKDLVLWALRMAGVSEQAATPIMAAIIVGMVLLFFGYTSFLVWYRYSRRISYARGLKGINYIKSTPEGTVLALRTLAEIPLVELIDEPRLRAKLVDHLKWMRPTQPVIHLAKEEDQRALMVAITNNLSELFAAGQVYEMMGVPMRQCRLEFTPTFEQYGGPSWAKLRIIGWKVGDLPIILGADGLTFEHPHHEDRIQTLEKIRADAERSPLVVGWVDIPIPEIFFKN